MSGKGGVEEPVLAIGILIAMLHSKTLTPWIQILAKWLKTFACLDQEVLAADVCHHRVMDGKSLGDLVMGMPGMHGGGGRATPGPRHGALDLARPSESMNGGLDRCMATNIYWKNPDTREII
nr:hypothetical protein [Candidatus Sigynarchaeum springense]